MNKRKPVVVAVSGGFDPIHIGHMHLFRDARALGDNLIVILNDDEWLMRKKGYVFMPQNERKELLENIRFVDEVVIREPRETSYGVSHMLEKLEVDIFVNGGAERSEDQGNFEVVICKTRGIKMVFGVGGTDKPQSSSWLVKNLAKNGGPYSPSGVLMQELRETGKAI